jgi:hypothetical protein
MSNVAGRDQSLIFFALVVACMPFATFSVVSSCCANTRRPWRSITATLRFTSLVSTLMTSSSPLRLGKAESG